MLRNHKTNTQGVVSKVILFFIGILFLLVVAVSTSPLTAFYGWDSSYFMLVGQGMVKGMLPYRDFFDMKGPYLYLIEYIGQLICWGRTGCFIMEVIHMTASLWIVDAIFRLSGFESKGNKKVFLILSYAVILYVASFSFVHGNLTEEYSLPWLLGAVYFALRYYKNAEATKDYRHPLWMGLYYGLVFGIMALIRINNAAIIGSIILSISIGLLAARQFKNLLLNGCAFILGTAITFLPMYFWYAARGLGGEMLNQVFFFGVQYSAQTGLIPKLYMLYNMRYLLLTAVLPLVVAAVYQVRSWRIWVLCLVSLLVGVFAVSMGFGLVHYIVLLIPNLVFGLAMLLNRIQEEDAGKWKRIKKAFLVIFLIGMCVMMLESDEVRQVYQHKISVFTGKEWDIYGKAQVEEVVSQVPEEKRDRIYAYGIDVSCSRWYAMGGLFPPHRYCDWQKSYMSMRPEIGEELEAWLKAGDLWVVTQNNREMEPELIANVIETHYTEVFRNEDYILYQSLG